VKLDGLLEYVAVRRRQARGIEMIWILVVAVLFVALANGANDNAKGVGALIGSGIAGAQSAVRFANVVTLIGSLAALLVAVRSNQSLIKAFGGGGLLPAGAAITAGYLVAIAIGAAATVLAATRLGMPVSTTHALLGALVGAGLINLGAEKLVWSALLAKFVAPLLLSPVLSCVATLAVFPLVRAALSGAATLSVDGVSASEPGLAGQVAAVPARAVVSGFFYLSSGAVCFARSLNDTPKIVGVLGSAATAAIAPSMTAVAVAMLVGGALFSRRVARTMAQDIAAIDVEQGLAALVVTAALVIAASVVALPVSTTHVAVGALAGAGLSRGTARWSTLSNILVAWVTTLPLAAALAAGAHLLLVR
jgi:PiT family inorganic phosphate transporter